MMDISTQRLRNLTTGILHTKMEDIYKDIEVITDAEGVMTHQLPAARKALEPYLRTVIRNEKFWDGDYDPDHDVGQVEVPVMTQTEQTLYFGRFKTEIANFWEKVNAGKE